MVRLPSHYKIWIFQGAIEIEDKVIYGFDPNIIILEYKNCCYFAVSEKGDYGKKNVKESE